jgi:hypothetical protein
LCAFGAADKPLRIGRKQRGARAEPTFRASASCLASRLKRDYPETAPGGHRHLTMFQLIRRLLGERGAVSDARHSSLIASRRNRTPEINDLASRQPPRSFTR